MYFPYFRGRQYELLALRELVTGGLINSYVISVVEPIKLTTTFEGTLKAYKETKMQFGLILNPLVGDLSKELILANPYV